MSLEDRLAAAEKAIAELTRQVGTQQDIEAIRRLQVS